MYRVTAYDAECDTHEYHTFELFVAAKDSEEALNQAELQFEMQHGCNIINFGCYTATPIMPAKTGRKEE